MGVMTWEGLAAMVRVSGAQIWGDSELASGLAKVKVKVSLSCPTLCDPMDYTIHGILQARELEWVVIPFSRGSSQPRDRTHVSRIAGRFFTSWALVNWLGVADGSSGVAELRAQPGAGTS